MMLTPDPVMTDLWLIFPRLTHVQLGCLELTNPNRLPMAEIREMMQKLPESLSVEIQKPRLIRRTDPKTQEVLETLEGGATRTSQIQRYVQNGQVALVTWPTELRLAYMGMALQSDQGIAVFLRDDDEWYAARPSWVRCECKVEHDGFDIDRFAIIEGAGWEMESDRDGTENVSIPALDD